MSSPSTPDARLPDGVSLGAPTGVAPSPEHRALEVLIGRWINEGATVAGDDVPATPIVTSDIYEWAPGGFFVVHTAYGRIGDVGVGGVEIIGWEPESQTYRCHFFSSEGVTSVQGLELSDGGAIWEGSGARCEATFSDDGRTLVAHHQRMTEDGAWIPSMNVTLRRVD